MLKNVIPICLILALSITAQSKDANKILDEVKTKFEKIRDYEVDGTIKLDFAMVKIPDTKAKIFFKQPDKVKIDAKGFAMLPKQSVNFSPSQFMTGDYTAIFVKSELINNYKLDVIKIIPNNDSSDIILSSLWIDSDEKVIRKIETTGKKSGTIQVDLTYDKKNLGLPSSVVFSFNLGNIPTTEPKETGNQDNDESVNRSRRNMQMSGKVFMTYENYKINRGLADSFFDEKKK